MCAIFEMDHGPDLDTLDRYTSASEYNRALQTVMIEIDLDAFLMSITAEQQDDMNPTQQEHEAAEEIHANWTFWTMCTSTSH